MIKQPTKEDILYNIEEGIIPKSIGEELIKQLELQKLSETLFPRGQVKQPYTEYEFELRSVSDDDK